MAFNQIDAKVRRRASVVCVDGGRLLAVHLQDPHTQKTDVYLPGGAIEPGESAEAAALRETLEETGYRVRIETGSARELRYPFTWNGKVVDCHTTFYRATLVDRSAPAPVNNADFHRGVEWVPLAQVKARFGFHAGILGEIEALLAPARFQTFAEFWPFYLQEHSKKSNRILHAIGTGCAILLILMAVAYRDIRLLFLTPIFGYGFAWFGHAFIQHNKPATFTYPLWSLLADLKMFSLILTGRLDLD